MAGFQVSINGRFWVSTEDCANPHPVAGSAKQAVCSLWSHEFGHELRLEANGELIASQVCRNSEQVLTTSEQWKKAMVEKGWN